VIIRTWVECSHEVDVALDRDVILEAFTEAPDANESWLTLLNRFAFALNALPDEHIAQFTAAQRATIRSFLLRHAKRFEEPSL
jgi:hypothetical protein